MRTLLESKTFKFLLELVPQVRALVINFCDSTYAPCLQLLQVLRPSLLLDIHFARHVEPIFSLISERILLQYFIPYKAVDLARMGAALAMDLPVLEAALAALIAKGLLPARIDSQSKTLHRRRVDERHLTIDKLKRLSQKHESEVRRTVLRLSLMQHGFSVQSSKEAGFKSKVGNVPSDARFVFRMCLLFFCYFW